MKKVLNTLFIIASLGLIAAGAIFLCVSIFDHDAIGDRIGVYIAIKPFLCDSDEYG